MSESSVGVLSKWWGWSKRHPWGTGAIVFGVGFVIIFLFVGKKQAPQAAQAQSGTDPNLIQAQLSHDAMAQSAGVEKIQSGLQAVTAQVSGQTAIATIESDYAKARLAAEQTVATQGFDLQKALGLAQIGADQAMTTAQIAGQTTLASISAAAQKAQDDAMFGFLNGQVASQFGFLTKQLDGQTAIERDRLALTGKQIDNSYSLQGASLYYQDQAGQRLSSQEAARLASQIAQEADARNKLQARLGQVFDWAGGFSAGPAPFGNEGP